MRNGGGTSGRVRNGAGRTACQKKPGYDSGPSDDPDRIVSIAEAARLSSLSIDTLRRRHRDKWLQLSERRFGMRRRDVLLL